MYIYIYIYFQLSQSHRRNSLVWTLGRRAVLCIRSMRWYLRRMVVDDMASWCIRRPDADDSVGSSLSCWCFDRPALAAIPTLHYTVPGRSGLDRLRSWPWYGCDRGHSMSLVAVSVNKLSMSRRLSSTIITVVLLFVTWWRHAMMFAWHADIRKTWFHDTNRVYIYIYSAAQRVCISLVEPTRNTKRQSVSYVTDVQKYCRLPGGRIIYFIHCKI